MLGQAYLVPRWNGKLGCREAVFQIGYRGLIDLAFRSSKVLNFAIRTAGANDYFQYQLGSRPLIEHRPAKHPQESGPATYYYATVDLVGGGHDFECMSIAEVQKHRVKYSPPPSKGQDYSAWATAFDAMAGKTVARRLAKRLPLSVEFVQCAVLDEYGESGIGLTEAMPQERADLLADKLDSLHPADPEIEAEAAAAEAGS